MGNAPSRAYRPGLIKSARPSRMMDALVFAIPCMLAFEMQLVGRLFLAEVMLLALAPILLLFKWRLLTAPMPRTLLILGLIWLMSQVATDLVRNTPFVDYSRGWAKITFTMINFTALYMLLHNSRRRLVLFALGAVIGGYLHHTLNPAPAALSDPWKFGLALPVTLLLVLGAQRGFERNAPRLVSLFLFFAAGLNLVMGFRSLSGICFVTAMFLFVQSRQSRPGARISRGRLIIITMIGIIGAIGFLEFYSYAARDGLLGAQAERKYKTQSSSKYGVLLGGRTEVLVALQAVADSPFLGHGSWAKDPKYQKMYFKLSGAKYAQQYFGRGSGLIPTHSFIFGAWVEAGFLGFVFWAYVLWLTGRNLIYLNQMQETLSPLIAYISFLMMWDIVFSPFGFDRRVLVPFFIIVVMFCWNTVLANRRSHRTMAPTPV